MFAQIFFFWQLRDKENNSNMFWALLDRYKEEEEGGGDMWQRAAGQIQTCVGCSQPCSIWSPAYLTELHWR